MNPWKFRLIVYCHRREPAHACDGLCVRRERSSGRGLYRKEKTRFTPVHPPAREGMPLSGREELSVVDFRQPEFFVEFQFHAIREFHLISVPVPFDFLKLRSRPPGRYCRNNLLRDKSDFNR